MPPRRFHIPLKHFLFSVICFGTILVTVGRPYPMSIYALEELAQAPVLVTVKIERIAASVSPVQAGRRTDPARATLLVLRCFPLTAAHRDERIELDYETLPSGSSGMNGPAVPPLRAGSIVVLPLRENPRRQSDAWRLIADEGGGLLVPAIDYNPGFASHPKNGREYLLQEIASALANGTRDEVLVESGYFTFQKTNGYASDLMALLAEKLNGDSNRLALITASIVSSLGMPRPTIAEFCAGKYASHGEHWKGSLAEAAIQKLWKSGDFEERLIHQLLSISDLNEWGAAVTLSEFALRQNLLGELRAMLKSRRPGSLYVAYSVLKVGQRGILPEATSAALEDVDTPGKGHAEIRAACWVIRDFGSDEQFQRLVRSIQKYQFQNQAQYDELWRNTIWSDNDRERVVLAILVADQRLDASGQRYSDIARGELARLQATSSTRR